MVTVEMPLAQEWQFIQFLSYYLGGILVIADVVDDAISFLVVHAGFGVIYIRIISMLNVHSVVEVAAPDTVVGSLIKLLQVFLTLLLETISIFS